MGPGLPLRGNRDDTGGKGANVSSQTARSKGGAGGKSLSESANLEAHGPSSVVDPPIVSEIGGDAKLNRGGVAWAIFEGGRDPYVILMTIYIFMPYVSATMVGDPVKGQELISRFQQYAGWMVMATAPFLGASIDKLGPRKVWRIGLMGASATAWHVRLCLTALCEALTAQGFKADAKAALIAADAKLA